jgi:hypothetical protein
VHQEASSVGNLGLEETEGDLERGVSGMLWTVDGMPAHQVRTHQAAWVRQIPLEVHQIQAVVVVVLSVEDQTQILRVEVLDRSRMPM